MASADVDFTEKIRMLNMNLKKEQEQAVKELQNGNDVLAVLPTVLNSPYYMIYLW